jgi:hypothetical protein
VLNLQSFEYHVILVYLSTMSEDEKLQMKAEMQEIFEGIFLDS